MKTNNDIMIYRMINEYVDKGLITPFEDNIIEFLATHTDQNNKNISNYLDGLNSNYSISKCYRFSRYLALAMDKPFHLYEGRIGNIQNGDCPHAFIETDNDVYDVTLIGKWPKELYYDLLNPIVETVVDLNSDERYQEYQKNTVEALNRNTQLALKYINWYTYMRHAEIPNPYFSLEPTWLYFPEDQERVNAMMFEESLKKEWDYYETNKDMPGELLSSELKTYMETKIYFKDSYSLYQELIRFIATNYDLYEEKKEDNDIKLWKKAIDDKYSGSLCMLISDMPYIIADIKRQQDKKQL